VTDRYIATAASGEHVVKTSSADSAARYAALMNGRVIDADEEPS
jgi:hypothetical protein